MDGRKFMIGKEGGEYFKLSNNTPTISVALQLRLSITLDWTSSANSARRTQKCNQRGIIHPKTKDHAPIYAVWAHNPF